MFNTQIDRAALQNGQYAMNIFYLIRKIFSFNKKIADYSDEDGTPFYYRTSSGRYFNVITDYPTGSSKEKPFHVAKKFTKAIGATLSTSLFWFYQQTYTNGFDLKQFEIETFPLFNLESLTPAQIEQIENLYDEYLRDIERNVRSGLLWTILPTM